MKKPRQDGSPAALVDAAADLARLIDGEVRFSPHDRGLYATDASLYQVQPLGVVIPRSREDLLRTVCFAVDYHLPLLARGAGSSLAGQAVNRALIIDCSVHLDRLLETDVEGRTCRVEPGLVLDQLNQKLTRRGTGLMFGPDVATSRHANLGGMIGNNSAGAHSILYGMTVDNLIGLDVILANGKEARLEAGASERDKRLGRLTQDVAAVLTRHADEIRRRFPKTVRRANGYNLDRLLDQYEAGGTAAMNLAHLCCGSEGTLAVTSAATLKLVPAPKRTGLAVLGFPSLTAALEAVNPILSTQPAAVELIDHLVMRTARMNREHAADLRFIESLAADNGPAVQAALYVEYFAASDEELREQLAALARLLPGMPQRHLTKPSEMQRAWALRKAAEPLLHAVPGLRKPITFVEDTAVDPARLPEFVAAFDRIVKAHGTEAAYYAHASVGCLHIRPLLAPGDADDRERMQRLAEEVTDLVREFGGALSGEHGDGRVRSPLLERFYGREICNAFAEIKRLFDPKNLLNPGNIVGPAPMLTHLRVNPNPHELAESAPDDRAAGDEGGLAFPDFTPCFDYSDQHGFPGAVQQCNGAGVCRKRGEGTMCPSYQATLDERHSTRGRGNALRLAITGQFNAGRLDDSIWNDAETLKTLDLCLSCKACQAECPSNVDIARLKAEYLNQHYETIGRVPLKASVVGHTRMLSRLASAAPRLSNFVANSGLARSLMQRLCDIDKRRGLPPYRPSLYRWHSSHRDGQAASVETPTVVLFADCFTTYNEPELGVAAIELLEAFGYRVLLPRVGCCGRTMLSVGMVRQAMRTADRTFAQLEPYIRDTNCRAILFCEPSCAAAFRDDLLSLRCQTDLELRKQAAAKAMLVEEFLDKAWEGHALHPQFAAPTGRIALHAHCQQKAVLGIGSGSALPARLFGERFTALDTGCCGMAGAFGYRPDHYELSHKIGELSVLPAARLLDAADVLLAPGTSCRHQIREGANVQALHPAQLLRQLLVGTEARGKPRR